MTEDLTPFLTFGAGGGEVGGLNRREKKDVSDSTGLKCCLVDLKGPTFIFTID